MVGGLVNCGFVVGRIGGTGFEGCCFVVSEVGLRTCIYHYFNSK